MESFTIIVLLLSQMVQLSFEVDVDQSTFMTRMKQLANNQLGISRFQQSMDDPRNSNVAFSSIVPNGQTMAAQIANDVEQSIQNQISAVRRIQVAFNNGKANNQIQTDLCCDLPNLSFDSRFQRAIDVSNVCHLTRLPMDINNDVKTAMIDNLQQYPNIKWQYYGTEDGRHCTYPARSLCNESIQFDPRVRSWYTSLVNIPRDIIILLDRSTPMAESYSIEQSTSKLTVAINAAYAILNYLNANDRVAVLGFSDNIISANDTSCFGRELAVANSNNVQELLNFVRNGISQDNSGSRPKFELALRTANQIFMASDANASNTLFSDREKIILMLSAGNTLENCQDLRNLEMQLFNNTVNIFMMEISKGSTSQTDCLRNLTTGPYGAHGFVPNSDFMDLRGQLGFFYNAFINRIDRTNVTFSIPFVDVNGLGDSTSVCLPLFSPDPDDFLLGVTCIEMKVSEILSEIVNFRLNKLSYGLVIDKRGRVVYHPLLTPPTNWQDQLPLLELKQVEISTYSFDVEKKITSGFPGNQTVSIKSFISVGQSEIQGVTKFETTATYYWNPIPSMKFFLCLVIVQNEFKSVLAWNAGLSNVFLSDEMDLSPNGKCNFFNRVVLNSTDTTVVKLAPRSFQSAESYIQTNLTASDLTQLKRYITWKGVQPQSITLKDGIRDVVAATSVLDSYWLPSTMDIQMKQNIMAMYIGTPDGVYRRYPSIRIEKTFDPTMQPWYKTAVSQAGQLILTLPYVDGASQLPFISLSQTVFSRRFGLYFTNLTLKKQTSHRSTIDLSRQASIVRNRSN